MHQCPTPAPIPQRPYLAVSAAIVRDGKVLVVRRARKPALNLYTLPGGAVETGETLIEAVMREVREETALEIEPVGLAGHREVIVRDAQGRVERHFVILSFAARWRSGEATAQRRTRRRALARCRPNSPACKPPRAWPRSSRPPSGCLSGCLEIAIRRSAYHSGMKRLLHH